MKKFLLAVLAVMIMVSIALAEEGTFLIRFATIGEAMTLEGYTGIAGGDDEHYAAVLERDGVYFRVVTDMDDEARRLSQVTMEYTDADGTKNGYDIELTRLISENVPVPVIASGGGGGGTGCPDG